MSTMHVPFYRHGLSSADAGAVAAVLDTSFLSAGEVGRLVEAQICRYFGVEAALLGNSWTNLAHATLLALGIGRGDEVIVPAVTFVACANVVELVGATPVLVDVDPETLLIDFAAVEAAISGRTRAVMPVHLYGQMCDMRALRELVDAHRPGIVLIEDCAHTFEGSFDGERPGRHGDIALFSFYGTKNVTCGEGGAAISNDVELIARVSKVICHGLSASSFDRTRTTSYRHWDCSGPGVQGKLPDLLAALLPRQIAQVDAMRLERQRIDARYRAELDPGIRLARMRPEAVSACHLFPIHVAPADRDQTILALNDAGIGVTINFKSIHRLQYYRDKYRIPDARLPVGSVWGDGQISLPLYPSLTYAQQSHVIETVNRLVCGRSTGAHAGLPSWSLPTVPVLSERV